jgi:outer membrane receptor protein involved in Fe transport
MFGKFALVLLAGAAMPLSSAWAQAATSAQPSGTIEEVIVTAQKTAQRSQDVPLTVSAVEGDKLAQYGAAQMKDVAATMPGLQLDSIYGIPGANTITLRGITTGTQASSTVATYIDDVPIGSSSGFAGSNNFGLDLFPYDLDHVEVLEGPQGTLYGASSLGGLVKYVTHTPSLTSNSFQFGGDALAVAQGSKAGWAARGAASVVVVPDKLAISISGAHQYSPGYIDNVATGEKDVNHGVLNGARAVVYWRPADNFSLKLAGLYNQSDFNDVGLVTVNPSGTPVYGRYKFSASQPDGQAVTTKLGSATADYDFGFANLTSITSYSDLHTVSALDASAIFGPIFGVDYAFVSDARVKKFTEEARLASPAEDRFHWMLGGFYTHEDSRYGQVGRAFLPGTTTPAPGLDPLIDGLIPSRFREWAVFANGTFKITDAWDVSGGARYSKNNQTVSETISGALIGGAVHLSDRNSSDDAVTYSVSSSYHFTPDVMAYARVASGYRPGGPNFLVPGFPPSYAPDTLTNYEVGLKGLFLERRLLFNVSAFDIDWRDIQLEGHTPTNLAFVANGGKASSKGLEATTSLKVVRGLTIGGSVAYTDSKLKDDAPQVLGRAGDRLPLTPRWAASATVDYNAQLTDKVDGHVGLAWRYTGSRHEYFPTDPQDHRLSSYGVINAYAGVSYGNVDINLYARNLTNTYDYSSWLIATGPVIVQPRTIGISIDYKLN